MPREGIDYPDTWVSALGCGIRCSINKLYTMLRGRIAKINSVTPDGNSQINIVSDSSQLTVTDDPDNYAVRLKVDLDGTDGLVTTDTAQTITAVKTFSNNQYNYALKLKSSDIGRADSVSGFTRLNQLQLADKNDASTGYIQNYLDGNGNLITSYGTNSPNGTGYTLKLIAGNSTAYVTAPVRTYSASNTDDVVTIGSLQASTDVIHTTGNQTKAGVLTFQDQIKSPRSHNNSHMVDINTAIPSASSTTSAWTFPIAFKANDNTDLGYLTFGRMLSGKSYMTLTLIDSNGVTKNITLGAND